MAASRAPRVLVTGAAGFIGRWSVPALMDLGYEVHAAVSARAPAAAPAELTGARIHRCDLFDEAAVAALLQRIGASHLLHFAWIAVPGEYWHSAENHRWLAASRHLLQHFQKNGGTRVVMAGTCAEYDWLEVQRCDELSSPLADTGAKPVSAYADCKLQLQRSLAQFAAAHGLSQAWGRIFFQFGPYEHPQRLVPSVTRNLLLGREAPCTAGSQVRSFLHVSDVGGAFAALLHSGVQGPVNIGSDEPISVAALIERIAQRTPRPDLVRLGARPAAAEPPLLLPEIRRLRDEVLWRPRFSLDAALSDTVAWWQSHLQWSP